MRCPKPDFESRNGNVPNFFFQFFFLYIIIESTSNGSLNFYHQIPGMKNRHLLVRTP